MCSSSSPEGRDVLSSAARAAEALAGVSGG